MSDGFATFCLQSELGKNEKSTERNHPGVFEQIHSFCERTGERLEISRMEIAVPSGEFVSNQLLTQLGLPGILNQVFLSASPTTAQIRSLLRRDELTKDQLGMVVTQLYWFEYASWGNPRMRVTQFTNWSNNNANTHFRKLAKVYGLPGLHSRKQK